MFLICSGLEPPILALHVYRKVCTVDMFCSFPQLIVCAAMYKLTPQYIVSYDQVNTCFVHVYNYRGGARGEERGEGGGDR